MGSVRTLLAISVLFFHAYSPIIVGGSLAVQLFFLISGFLISYVLVEAKTYATTGAFYKNRALRLYPLYLAVALATLVFYLTLYFAFGVETRFIRVFQDIDWAGRMALAVSNLAIFGQDWILFTAVRDGSYQLTGSFWPSEVPVWQGLLIDPGWSLGVELTFYLVAPFVLPHRRVLMILLTASLMLRAVFILAGFGLYDPWYYRFFPTELAIFLFGALSHQTLYPLFQRKGWLTKKSSTIATGLILAYCLCYYLLPGQAFHRLALIAATAVALPFLFHFQNHFRFDRKIGDLSYPIYIVHMPVIIAVSLVYDRLRGDEGYMGLDKALVVLALTLLISLVLHRTIDAWVERKRDRIRGRTKAQTPPAAGARPQLSGA